MNGSNLLLGIVNTSTAALCIIVGIPLLRGKVKMNRWYGVRFKKSFVSEENWYKINRYGAKQLIIWSIPLFLLGVAAFFLDFVPNGTGKQVMTMALAFSSLILLVPCLLSYLYARRS